jgi:soluble lytic murein transglycosylase-like protein
MAACKIDLRDMIIAEANDQGVPPEIALAVATRETGMCHWRANGDVVLGDPTKYGRAIGVMQLLPQTAAAMGVDPYDVNGNIHGGVKYLSQLYDQFGDWTLAVQHYNGSGPDARAYAARVMAIARGFGFGMALSASKAAGSKSNMPPGAIGTNAVPVSTNTLIMGGIVAGAGLLAWAWAG